MKNIKNYFIIIYIFCLLSIIYAIFSIRSAYQYNYYNSKAQNASQALSKLKRESNEVFAIQKELNKFYTLVAEDKFDLKELEKQCNDFNQTGFNFIKIKFFDKKHNPININNLNNNDVLNGAMQRLYFALASYKLNNNDSYLKRYRSLFETLLGAIDLHKLAIESSALVPITLSGKPGYIYWNLYESDSDNQYLGGMIAWLKKSEIPNKLLTQRMVEKLNIISLSEKEGKIFGFIDTNLDNIHPEKILNSASGIGYRDLFTKIQELKASLKSYDILDDYLINYVEFSKDKYFFSNFTL